MAIGEARPEWGHPIQTPDGREIRLPAFAFPRLRQLGVLKSCHGGVPVLRPAIHDMLRREYDCLTEGLRHLIGEDLTGPSWLVCNCVDCREREADADNTAMPGRARSQMLAEDAMRESQLAMQIQTAAKVRA